MRFHLITLAVCAALALTACDKKPEPSSSPAAKKVDPDAAARSLAPVHKDLTWGASK